MGYSQYVFPNYIRCQQTRSGHSGTKINTIILLPNDERVYGLG